MAATNKRGVFSLEKVLERQSDNNWTNVLDPFIYQVTATVKNNFGFFAGYHDGGHTYSSTIFRHDYSDDTVTSSSQLTVAKASMGAISNSDYGYWFGGRNPSSSTVSSIDRLDFNNNTTATSPKGNLAETIWINDSAGNTSYGYAHGQTSGFYKSKIFRIDYSNDTATAPSHTNLPYNIYYGSGLGNQNYGYWAGGTDSSMTYGSFIHRLDFGNDTATATPKGNINPSSGSTQHAGAGNANYGYVGGGNPAQTLVRRIDYSNDTAQTVAKGPLASTFKQGASTSNHSHGYWIGGGTNSKVQKIDYSNDTATGTIIGNIPGGTQAFFTGDGGTGALENGNPEITVYPAPAVYGAATSTPQPALPTVYGPSRIYACGGIENGASSYTSRITRMDYSNNTRSDNPGGNLPEVLTEMTGANSNAYGWMTGALYGYTNIYRLDFSSETSTKLTSGKMLSELRYRGAVSNINYGYWTGGSGPAGPGPSQTLVERVDWANDNVTASPRGNTEQGGWFSGGAGNKNYGYIGGGYQPALQRIDYSNDSVGAVSKGGAAAYGRGVSATGNISYGYWNSGYNYPNHSTVIYRFDYANDTSNASARSNAATGVAYAGPGSSETTGFFCGGFTGVYTSPSTATHQIQSFDYASDTSTNPGYQYQLYRGVASAAVVGSRSNAIYEGGPRDPIIGYIPRIRWIDSAPESSPSPGPDISPSAGYIMGGNGAGSPSYNAPAQKIDFSNDTATAVVKGAPSSSGNDAYYSTAVGNRDYGYMTGGRTFEEVHRLDYSNDTAQMLEKGRREPNSVLGYEECATGNLNYGWFNGGYANYSFPGPAAGCPGTYAPNLSHIYRIDYANDTNNPTLRAYNTVAAGRKGACGNNNYGYWIGGSTLCYHTTGNSTYVERTDYASDTTNSVAKGNTTVNLESSRGQGNKDFGYSLGMSYGRSFVQRIDYANDTNTATPKGNLAYNFKKHGSTGNQPFGYAAGGSDGPGYGVSIVNRVDYSNDTATASPKGPLANAVQEMGGCSASENQLFTTGPEIPGLQAPYQRPFNHPPEQDLTFAPGPSMGYVLGGAFPYSFSTVDRVDYANDTATAAVKGPLSAGTSYQAAVSNKSHGYSLGGKTPGEGKSSKVDRVDYANDTATAAVKGPLSAGYYRSYAGVGNKEYGYLIGGNYPSAPWSSITQRIEYASDTSTATTKGPMAGAVYLNAGAGNLSYGYSAGGSSPSGGSSNYSTVERLDYVSDTSTMVVKGPLAQGARKLTATGTASYGYWGGGTSPNISMIQRLDYASDTSTAVAKGPLTMARDSFASFSAPGHGYFAGDGGPIRSTVERMDYSNDTATATVKGPLSLARGYDSGVSAQDIGGALK